MARAFLVALVLVCAAAAQSSPLVWTGTTQCDFHECRTGNLTVHIDPDDPSSPKLTLKVAMVHAAAIPAPQGPILLHCGGPGSGKDCALGIAGLYPDLAAQFDFWSIDQRGIGGKLPHGPVYSPEGEIFWILCSLPCVRGGSFRILTQFSTVSLVALFLALCCLSPNHHDCLCCSHCHHIV